MHYQACCDGQLKFGDEFTIVGDFLGKSKYNYNYNVWGTSEDPSTWFEQNKSIAGAPQRQMKREIVERLVDKSYALIIKQSNDENREESESDEDS